LPAALEILETPPPPLPIALMAVTDPFLRGYSVATPLVYASRAGLWTM